MGSSSSALKCITEKGLIRGKDLDRLMRTYAMDMGGMVNTERALQLCEDLEEHLTRNGHQSDLARGRAYVAESGQHVPFAKLLQILTEGIMSAAQLDLTASAAETVFELQHESEPPQNRQIREFGKTVKLSQLQGRGGTESANPRSTTTTTTTVIKVDPAGSMQADAPITHLPRDVMCMILLELTMGDMNAAARTCRRMWSAASAIFSRIKPPVVVLDPSAYLPGIVALKQFAGSGTETLVSTVDHGLVMFIRDARVVWADGEIALANRVPPPVIPGQYQQKPRVRVADLGRFLVAVTYFGHQNGKRVLCIANLKEKRIQELGEISNLLPMNGTDYSEDYWYVHQLASGHRFAFCFITNRLVAEIHLLPEVPEKDVHCSFSVQEGLFLVVLVRAMQEFKGGDLRFASYKTDSKFAKDPSSPLYVLTGAEWLDELHEYDPESRLWNMKNCSGYLPTAGSVTIQELGKPSLIAVLLQRGGGINGGMYFLNTKLAYFTHVSLGLLRSIPLSGTQGLPTVMKPGVVMFSMGTTGQNSVLMMVDAEFPSDLYDENISSRDPELVLGVETRLTSFILTKLSKRLASSLKQEFRQVNGP